MEVVIKIKALNEISVPEISSSIVILLIRLLIDDGITPIQSSSVIIYTDFNLKLSCTWYHLILHYPAIYNKLHYTIYVIFCKYKKISVYILCIDNIMYKLT